jgi:hypothetical protein
VWRVPFTSMMTDMETQMVPVGDSPESKESKDAEDTESDGTQLANTPSLKDDDGADDKLGRFPGDGGASGGFGNRRMPSKLLRM